MEPQRTVVKCEFCGLLMAEWRMWSDSGDEAYPLCLKCFEDQYAEDDTEECDGCNGRGRTMEGWPCDDCDGTGRCDL